MPDPEIANLGPILRARRREKHLSLRDLSDLIGVPSNTLSRVERGDVPDLKNFRRIVEWLELPAERFLEAAGEASTPQIIARHLRADRRLPAEAAQQIMEMVEEMYHRLVGEQPTLSLHLRSAKTFTPGASTLLADILSEMQSNLQAGGS
ncbi:MAG TPA: helix-turn-helix transcriptional regulator [Acidimicrobiales bacterium]|nr:helix-turn-helix transcriptional regulator [Acidimicrobiales bacterium]